MVVELGIDGVIATNTTIRRAPLTTDATKVEAIGAGGLSGRPLRERSLQVLRILRAALPDHVALIAAGGIESAEDARSRLQAGASLVQAYTAFVYGGPLWPARINKGLLQLGITPGQATRQ